MTYREGVGCDFSRTSIALARKAARTSHFVVCDSRYLPFKSNTFETVSCLGSLEHYSDPGRALNEARRVTRRNGKFLVSITNKNRWTSIFRFIIGGPQQPLEKPLSVSEASEILGRARFSITRVTNPHQFDFRHYASLPKFICMFLNKVDEFAPVSSAIEPLYLCQKA